MADNTGQGNTSDVNTTSEVTKTMISSYPPLNELLALYQRTDIVVGDDEKTIKELEEESNKDKYVSHKNNADEILVEAFFMAVREIRYHFHRDAADLFYFHNPSNQQGFSTYMISTNNLDYRLVYMLKRYLELRNYMVSLNGKCLEVSLKVTN
jgi:hypothetical protein